MNNSVSERFKFERKRLDLSQEDLARLLEISDSTIKRWEGGAALPSDKLLLCAEHGFDIVYILLGSALIKESKPQENSVEDVFSNIPVYDVEVSAGAGAIADGTAKPVSYFPISKEWIQEQGLYLKDLLMVKVRGDSMYPTIEDKEPLLINTADKSLTDSNVYVIRNDDTMWVKRIQRMLGRVILLKSDNGSLYDPIEVDLEKTHNFEVIGRWVPPSKKGAYY